MTYRSSLSALRAVVLLMMAAYLSGCGLLQRETRIEGEVTADVDSVAREVALDHYLSGSVSEEAGELPQAAVQYQIALMFDPQSLEISVSLADVYMRLGYREAAVRVLEKVRENSPDNEELLTKLTELYLQEGLLLKAADCLEALAEARPLDETELTRLAGILTGLQRFDEALKLYGEYIERFGPNPEVYGRIGRIHLLRRDIEAADTTFRRLVELDSTEHKVFFVLGGFAVSREDWGQAERYFRQALTLDSTQILYWSNLLLALNQQHKNEQALKVVDEAIDRFPEQPQLYDIRGSILQMLKRFDEALKAVEQSIAIDSTRLSPYLTKGFIHHTLDEWDAGAQAYERALAIEPDNPVVLNNYAYMLSEQNQRLEDALQMVERALAGQPDSPSFMDTKGWILYRLGRYKEALALVERAMKGETENAELYEHMGYIYQAMGKTSKARTAWRRAAELDPENEEYARLAR